MEKLTERQKRVLDFITAHIGEHKYPPTVREIAVHFEISTKRAHDHIAALKNKGWLKTSETRCSRALEINGGKTQSRDGFLEIPLLGDVAAGKCIYTEENHNGTIRVHASMLKEIKRYFALKVRGDSMTGIGVMDGDTVIIEQRNTARNGDVVVVDIDDGGRALKRFYRQANRIRLQSENPAYPPMYSTDVRILGKLAVVYRTYDC